MDFCTLFTLYLLFPSVIASIQASPAALASQYSLPTSTTLPFPTSTLSTTDSQSFIVSEWSLSRGRIEDEANDLAFVDDPFSDSSSSSPVLQVTYPAGSYSHDTGGSQFVNLWNSTGESSFESMLLSYEVAFDQNFNWMKGGKLPGLRGGPNVTGCDGGDEPTGFDCFSARLMWRADGAGEVYAYIPTTKSFCKESDITCNSDFGVSVSRGSFTFISGGWNRIALLVQMNNPVTSSNGNLQLYLNDNQVISQQNIRFRAGTSVNTSGLFFSTFFGGSDDSWATPVTTHTYYRNLQLWAGSNPSNATATSSAMRSLKTTFKSSFNLASLCTLVILGVSGRFLF